MVMLPALLVPILLSAVIVFVVSSIIHMALPWHKNDFPKVPDEARFRAAVGPLAIPPGEYMVPRCNSMAEMKTPEFKEKMAQGPVMIMTVMPNGVPGMGRALGLWFVYLVVVSVFAAYVAGHGLGPDAPYLKVFQLVGASAFMAYALALWQGVIWYHGSAWRAFLSTIDGLIYACFAAGTFGWLWPR